MEKTKGLVLVLLVLLSGCQNNKRIACNLIQENKSIDLDIRAINDDISSIDVRTSFIVPNETLFDDKKLEFLKSQLDNSYHFEDNKLIREYSILIDNKYSLDKTLEDLRKKRYYCE